MQNLAITNDDLTLLQQKLIIPSAVADIIKYDLKVEEEMQYNLHMALSETDPDSALLAIAMGTYELARKHQDTSPIANALYLEASNIMNDYAPTWLRYQKGRPMPSDIYTKVLNTVPEDLEAIADLLDALAADLQELGEDHANCLALGEIFAIQARAHMEIALFVLDEMKTKDIDAVPAISQTESVNNILLFPIGKAH